MSNLTKRLVDSATEGIRPSLLIEAAQRIERLESALGSAQRYLPRYAKAPGWDDLPEHHEERRVLTEFYRTLNDDPVRSESPE